MMTKIYLKKNDINTLKKVVEYLHEEEKDFNDRPQEEQKNHIWLDCLVLKKIIEDFENG